MKKLKDDILPLFMTAVMADSEGDEKTLRGLAAAKQQLRAARNAARTDEIDFSHIADLTTFDFLLSEDEANEVQKLLKGIWVKAGQAGATAASRVSGRVVSHNGPTQPKKRRTVLGAQTPEINNVANLFV